jgi:large subunit ribosomal protein L25
MKEVLLEAENREITTRGALNALRASGKIVAEYYGHNEKNMHLSIDAKRFEKMMQEAAGGNFLVNLKVGSVSKTAIIKEIQRDMISQKPVNIDFQAISATETLEVNVHIHIVGIAPGVKMAGGILEHVLRDIKVKCLPKDIPQFIEVDVNSLQIGQQINVAGLPKLAGVEYLADEHQTVISVVAPTILEEKPAEGVAGAAAAEPEVIAKGKKPEEGEAAAADDKGKKAEPKK